jgi:Zn-dependent M28 family amino/carboxypeptidase
MFRLTGRCTAFALALLSTAATLPAQSTGDAVTTRMMARLSALSADSMEGRRAGTPGSARARQWIIGELTAMGAKSVGASFAQPVVLPARAGADTNGANIVARIPGKKRDGQVIVISAHYDHLGVRNGQIYNGADDDASGCVALLTIAERLLKSAPDHDVILAFFDNEEGGMHGSRTFVSSGIVPLEKIALDVSLDMVARQDGKALWVSGLSHYPALKAITDVAAKSSAIPIKFGHDTKDLPRGDDWTNSSDHAAFHAKGIPFLYLGVEDHPDYHKPGDDADKVDATFYRGAVEFAFAVVKEADKRLDGLSKAK